MFVIQYYHAVEITGMTQIMLDCIKFFINKLSAVFKDTADFALFNFSGHELSSAEKYAPYASCDNMMDFVSCLRNSDIVAQEKKPCIIVSVCYYVDTVMY
jgi:hypothetical protein